MVNLAWSMAFYSIAMLQLWNTPLVQNAAYEYAQVAYLAGWRRA